MKQELPQAPHSTGIVRAGAMRSWLARLSSGIRSIAGGSIIETPGGALLTADMDAGPYRLKVSGSGTAWRIDPGLVEYSDSEWQVPILNGHPITEDGSFMANPPFQLWVRWYYTPDVSYDSGPVVAPWQAVPYIEIVEGYVTPGSVSAVVTYNTGTEQISATNGTCGKLVAYVSPQGTVYQFIV